MEKWTIDHRQAPDLLIQNEREVLATIWMSSNTDKVAKLMAAAPQMKAAIDKAITTLRRWEYSPDWEDSDEKTLRHLLKIQDELK